VNATHPDGLFESYTFDLPAFANYLEGIVGGNRNEDGSKAIVRDVKLFFQ